MKKEKRNAFTLAEVLITLAIIGVVAALTIPTLITKMSERSANARKETIEARLLDGINRYSTLEDGLSKPYETTYDFLVGLSKHYKMAQICKADEITNCIPYDKIFYGEDGNIKNTDVSSLTAISSFMENSTAKNYLAPASFITAQGTPVIMAFKKDCAWDTGKAMRSITDSGCIAYMYDESGARLPNRIGKDWVLHGLTVDDFCFAKVSGYKIMEQPFLISTNLTKAQCQAEIAGNYGITECYYGADTWAAAMKYCHDKGYRLPNEAESEAIAKGLFKDASGNHPSSSSWNADTYKIDLDLVSTLGLKNADGSSITQNEINVSLWSSVQYDNTRAYRRYIVTNYANWIKYDRNYSGIHVLCLGE